MEQQPTSPAPAGLLEALMARIAAGDTGAVYELHVAFRVPIRAAVRRAVDRHGARLDADELDGLVIDACHVIADVAGAWRPGGAKPWVWAEQRIRRAVGRALGQWCDPFDEHAERVEALESSMPAAADEPALEEMLERLAAARPDVRLLVECCEAARVGTEGLLCILDYRMQLDQGDPSPAHTLAARYGVSPQTLRQRVSRGHRKLRTLVARDPRYASLAEYALVA